MGYWDLQLISELADCPFPVTKEELLEYANRTGASEQVIENIKELDDEDEIYESLSDVWPELPSSAEDFFFNEEEY